jgi:DNA-binding LacI/PurR family transcriptional regulator
VAKSKDSVSLPRCKAPAFVPLYRTLFEHYRSGILTQKYQPGAQIDSINEIQDVHGVSRETAKLVLGMLAKEGLIVQKPGKGSFVADLGPRKPVWGMVLPCYTSQMESLLYHLGGEAERAGRTIEHYVDYNSWEEEIRLVGNMVSLRYEAVVVVPTFDESKTSVFYRRMASGGTIVALLDHSMAGSYFPYAIQSHDLGVRRAVEYLLRRTNGAIAFVKNDIWIGRNMVQELMEATFKSALEDERTPRTGHVVDHLRNLTEEFLSEREIGGIFCCDDMDAIRVLGRLREWGIGVPERIALVSYGNTDLARYAVPAITSVDCHAQAMVTTVSEIIRKGRDGQNVSSCQYVIQPELVVRAT